MELVLFAITALVAIVGAVAMLLSSNAIHSALFLLLNFCAIAVLYLLLNAPFLFAIQLIIYAGAIIVLFLFAVMLLGAERAEDERDTIAWQRPVALVMGLILAAQVAYVVLTGTPAPAGGQDAAFGAPERIARELFTTYLLPFEVTAMLILAALVGVVVLHIREKRQVS
ncbi:MAG: NADH-quinone oxidoreductase subunit J [Chloroflexota bacterium]|nr:MAG: NADH-quinone oxidoreductase subunit J [Chloroflexota bacterium]